MEKSSYRIIRSPRRTRIALHIAVDGAVEISAPINVPQAVLDELCDDNHPLIKRLRERAANRLQPPPLKFEENGVFWLLGKEFPLHLSNRARIFDGSRFVVPRGSEAEIRSALELLYRELALSYFTKRMKVLSERTGVAPEALRISSTSGRWGSRSSSGTIALSWKLLQCPAELVDYVICHELAHILEMNHSPKFWRVVEKFCPDYRRLRSELVRFSRRLPVW